MFFRFRATRRDYLRRFPPVEGVPLDIAVPFLLGDQIDRAVSRALRRVLLTPQSDPELEALRRLMWRRYRHVVYWLFGFPAAFLT